MNWVQISGKEWQRRPRRTAVTAAGVAIASGGLFSLLAFQQGYREGLRDELGRLGAHVLVVPKGCPYDAASMALHGATWPCYLKARYLDEVRAVRGVAAAAPVFMTTTEDHGGQTVYVGVQRNILQLRPGWKIQGTFPDGEGGLLLGAEAARRCGWRLGQQVPLPGMPHRQGMVTGIIDATQGADDRFIYLRLNDAQKWFNHPEELTHILVKLRDPDALNQTVSQLRGCDAGMSMNVVPLAHLFHTIQALSNSTRVLLGTIALVALLVAATGVSIAVLTAVVERQRDLGVLRAIGATRAHIFKLVLLGTLYPCGLGGLAGIAAAFLASRSLEAWVRTKLPFSPADSLLRWEWWMVGACLASVLLLGALAGLLPAYRAASLPPLAAMRPPGGCS